MNFIVSGAMHACTFYLSIDISRRNHNKLTASNASCCSKTCPLKLGHHDLLLQKIIFTRSDLFHGFHWHCMHFAIPDQ